MISRTPDEQASIDMVAKGNVRFVTFIQRWMDTELKRLPAAMSSVERMQGRAQVLQELHDILHPAAALQPTKT
jgi:hypothetical protein